MAFKAMCVKKSPPDTAQTGCTILPRCFCVQGTCSVQEGYVGCAVLVRPCKVSRGMYARENWVHHWRWHQG